MMVTPGTNCSLLCFNWMLNNTLFYNIHTPWVYTPLSVKLQPNRKNSQAQALSGIYVFNPAHTLNPGFCLTVSHVPIEEIQSNYEIQVAAPHFSNQKLVWLDAKAMANIAVFGDPDPLFDHISMCVQNGFRFLPSHTVPGNFSINSLCILILSCEFLLNETNRRFFESFLIQRATVPSQITIRSCPFSFTNCTFFADFKSTGHISMVIDYDEINWGYLSDIKYLENMIGGLVMNAFSESVGVVLGNLRKLNGDGDLIVVLPWERIISRLLFFQTNFGMCRESGEVLKLHLKRCIGNSNIQHKHKSNELPRFPVFPIVFYEEGAKISWGTCVLFNHGCLMTNTHVIQPFHDRDKIDCEILLGKRSSIFLLGLDKIVNLPKHLDLTFILLSPENKSAFSEINPIDLSFQENTFSGDHVYSVGYGLFLSNPSTPLVSKGHISSTLMLLPFNGKDMNLPTPKKIPCMLITSSSCWNGSSGGGLFERNGKFLGIICCNAEVRVPSIPTENSSKSEKIPLVGFCIPSELILECYRLTIVDPIENITLSHDLVRAWNLESYHTDVSERQNKL